MTSMEDTALYYRELLKDFKTRITLCLYFQTEKKCTSLEDEQTGSENEEKAMESKDN